MANNTGITYNSISATGNSVSFWRNNTANQNDDNRSNPINLGFDFWYLGTRYTTVNIGLNGFIDFSGAIYDGNGGAGTVNCGGAVAYRQDPIAFSTSGCAATPPTTYSGTYIALAPLYTDLWVSGGTAALANSVKYLTVGVAPNRVFTVEYINYDDFGGGGVASLNFQVKLYETSGKIEFVYGSMVGSGGGGTTTTNYALGINNSTMSAVPTVAQLLVQQTENTATFSNAIKNNLTLVPASNSMISFTSNIPADPGSTLTFTGVTNTDMTLNWTDWAANEDGYVLYNSTDGVNFSFARQVASNTISSTFNGLFGSTYFWQVYAVTEGTLSAALTGSQATLPGANFVSQQTGPWNTGSTWIGGFVPTAGDNAVISAGHTVTIGGSNSITNLTVDGTLLVGDNATVRTFTVLRDVSISATGTFSSGSAATHSLIFQGNVANNGTLNMSPGGGSLTNVTFNKTGSQTFSGAGATTNFNLITLNMGTSSSNVADFTCSNFSAPTDFLTLLNGTFKFSVPASAVTLNLYSAGTTILSTTGFFMNSPNSTVNFLSTMNFQGDLTVNSGTVNVGDAADENLTSNGSDITINGGLVQVAGRFTRPSYISITNFTMTGGTLIVNTQGSNDAAPPASTATAHPFMIDVPGSKFIMTSGTIIIRQSGIGAGPAVNLGYNNTNVTNYTFSGGTIQIGDALTPAANSMKINTDRPIANLVVFTTNGPTALLSSALIVTNSIAINATSTLNCQNLNLTVGGSFSNDGTFTAGTNTTTFNGTTPIFGASITTFNNVTITGTLNGHVVNMNVNGNWTNNAGTFNPGTGIVTFTGAGAQAINGTAASQTFNHLTINKAAGTLSTAGSTTTLTIQGNYTQTLGNFTPIAGGTINVGGNWTHDAGAFTANTNNVNFNGTGAQQITSAALATEIFYRLTLNKTPGTLLSTGGTFTTLTITNNYTQTTGDFAPPANFNVAGNWTHDAGTFTAGAGTVTFNGAGAQQISSAALTTETFNNLIINKTAGTLLNTSGTITTITLTGNYTNTQGNFTLPATFNVGGNVTITAGTVTAGTLFDVKGNWAHNAGTFTAATSTVSFTGTGAQQMSGVATETFFNLTINKTPSTLLNTAAAPITITVQNNYTQTDGDFTPPATMNVGGNWTHDAGTFTPGAGLVVFNGTGAQQISSSALTTENFNNLTVNKTAGTLLSTAATFTTITVAGNFINTQGNFTPPATLTIGGNATLTAGTITAGTLIDIKGNWTNNGATFTAGTGTVSFTGVGAQAINGTAVTQTFNHLTINKTVGTTLSSAGSTTTLTIQGNYTQTQGNFTPIAGGTTNVAGNWTHDAGTFTPGTGTVVFNGTGAQQIASTTLATETFNIMSVNKTAGTLLNTSGAITAVTTNSNYVQTQGDFTAPATFTIIGNATLTAGTLTAGALINPRGNWTNNGVTLVPGTGTVSFTGNSANLNGTVATQTFYNFTVNKTAGQTLTNGGSTTTITIQNNYTQTLGNFTVIAGGTINVGGNWIHDAGAFTPGTSTVIFNGTGAQQISSAALVTETFYNFTVNKTAGTLLNTGANPTTITIQNIYTQTQGDFTPPATLNVAGNWVHDAGTFTPGAGLVVFNGAGAQTMFSSALTTETFNNLTVNKTAGTLLNVAATFNTITVGGNYINTQGNFTLPATLNVFGNVTLTAGTVTAGTLVDSKGNWTNNGGTFTPGTGTVTFTGAGAQVISGTAVTQTFYNLTVNKTVGTTLSTAAATTTLTIQNNYTETQGNFTPIAAGITNVGGNWVHDGGTFTPGTGTVVFNGTGAQQISSTTLATETFNNMTVNKTAGTLLNTGGFITAITTNSNYVNTQGDFNAPATLTITGNATLTAGNLTAGALVDSKGNWTNNGGTFTPGTGTVSFTGVGAQALNGTALSQTFYNVLINKTVGTTLTNGGSTTTVTIQNNYTQTQGNFTAIAAGTINVGGNWTHDAGVFTPSTGTVNFNGTGAQQITSAALVTETFNKLTINKTAGTLLNTGANPTTITVTSNYTQTQGDFTPPATLNVGGNWTHDAGTFTPGTGLVVFNGGAAQTISNAAFTTESFYNMTVSKGGGSLLNTGGTITTISVANNYTNTLGNFTAPATLNVAATVTLTAGTFTAGTLVDVKGNWAHNGGVFTPGTNTVTFTGTGAQQITGIATETFYNLTINKTAATLLNTGANPTTITVTNNYTQTQGNFTPPATLNVGGNWTHDAGTFTPGAGLVNFNGVGAQQISSSALATETYFNMTVNKAGGTLNTGGTITTIGTNNNFTNTLGTFTAPATLNVTNIFTVTAGTVTGGTAIDVNSNVVLTNGTFVAPTAMNVFGNWTKALVATFTQGTGTTTFDGTGAQTINGTSVTQVFYNLVVNKTAGILLNVGGSTTTLTVQDYTNTQGNFTPPATFSVNGNVLLTLGTFTAGTNVNVTGNWTRNGGTFTPGANTVTFNSTTAQQNINGTQSTPFGRLTFNNTFVTAPQVVIAASVTVATQLTMTSGIVRTDATNFITMLNASAATIGSSASFITGPMQFNMAVNATTRTLNFPIGKNNLYGGAALIIQHSAVTAYSYTTEVIHSSARALNYTLAAGTTHVSGLRYWDMRRGLTASPLVTDNTSIVTGVNGPSLQLYYEVADEVTDPANLTIVKNIGGGTAWFGIGGTASGAAPGNILMAASSANFTTFSFMTLANLTGGSNPLPITLVEFSGRQSENEILLHWKTESETQNDRFELEKLTEGEKFVTLGSIMGAGNSTKPLMYSYYDQQPEPGINYYRLRQVDWDGASTRSEIIAVSFVEVSSPLSVAVSPNPTGNEVIGVKIEGAKKNVPLVLRIYDLNGRTVAQQEILINEARRTIFTWNLLQPLGQGVYILQGVQGYSRSQDKLIVK